MSLFQSQRPLPHDESPPVAPHPLSTGAPPPRTAVTGARLGVALGAWLGAMAFDRIARRTRVDDVLIGRLSLELPLIGLVYLMVPLLWRNSLAPGTDADRGVLSLLLGVFGASLLGGMQRHHFGPIRSFALSATAAAASLWFLVGAFPALTTRPETLLAGVLLVAALSWWKGRTSPENDNSNRRFEVPRLTSAAPAYGAYLALLIPAPLLQGIGTGASAGPFPE